MTKRDEAWRASDAHGARHASRRVGRFIAREGVALSSNGSRTAVGEPRGRNVPAVSRSRSSGLAAALHSPSAQGRREVYAKCRTIGAPSLRLRDAKPARHGRVYRGAAGALPGMTAARCGPPHRLTASPPHRFAAARLPVMKR
ncbi:hypothetical protein [Burkholderia pseudomallei]|uniref:hypothetical protein n=1 Tax=Burkholderia pseudomallei TaxID=28450 RepID=UPI0012B165FA|nr:hypothetical protein [Burkholderia pseudomallei]MDV2164611.1 hypothetical protein [Burkholderia pseudomallei]MDV2238031.1 hypothetical protein [Burkholderia pseudomallei]QGS82096.1 hypothetical protein PMC2000_26875 [Burkholderia pseudomallei]QGT07781.1 hypothetical protein D286_26730 [Burkholderia pseudomallei]